MNTASKSCCEKEKGSYKFMLSLETVAFYCKKVLQHKRPLIGL